MRRLAHRAAAALAATLVLSACGDDGADTAVDETPSPTVSTSVDLVPTTPPSGIPGATPKPGKTKKPGTSATPSPVASAVATPKASKKPKPGLLYPEKMPDGRTAPVAADFSFSNFKLDQRFLGTTIATLDVLYKGPGTADAMVTAHTKYTTEDGKNETVELQGVITKIKSGAKVNIRLSGASNLPPRIKSGYSATYTVTSVSDDDPAARAE